MKAYSESDILDRLAEACARFKAEGRRGIDWTFDHTSERERLAFDLFLVRTRDSLAYEPGTTEYRFRARVLAMVQNKPLAEAMTEAKVEG